MHPRRLLLSCLWFVVFGAGCRHEERAGDPQPGTKTADHGAALSAAHTLSAIRDRFTVTPAESTETGVDNDLFARKPWSPLLPGIADRFESDGGRIRPVFSSPMVAHAARVSFPATSMAAFQIEAVDSGMLAEITMRDTRETAAESFDGYVIYRGCHISGATVLHRALPTGTEEFVSFATRPSVPEVLYQLGLVRGVRGLRLVANTLEMLDDEGAPRLRVAPPYLIGSDGVATEAKLALEDCAADTSSAPPWGRRVTAPGGDTCAVRVTWSNDAVVYPALLDPTWSTTGSMATARQAHTATVLSTGKVLVVGGQGATAALADLNSAELYDPATGTWAATASITGTRHGHAAVQLNTSSNTTTSGKVLVAGGKSGTASVATAQLYSAATGTWVAATNMNAARHDASATLLANGRVLLAGGVLNASTQLATAAVYDPTTGAGTWTAVGSLSAGRSAHSATRLTTTNATLNNKVLVVGGFNGTASVATVQLFDGTSAWSTLANLSSPRQGHTATLLANGKLVIAGGKNVTASATTILATAQLFDPSTGSGIWTSAGTMTAARELHSATLLSSAIVAGGQVLVTGGSNTTTATLGSAELFDGVSTWTATASLVAPTKGHTASLLGSGSVLIAGGTNGAAPVGAAELYDSSRGLSCSSNSQCISGFCAGGVCCVQRAS